MKTNEQKLLVKFIEEGKDTVKEDFHVFSLKDQKNKDDNGKNGERETVRCLVLDMLAWNYL